MEGEIFFGLIDAALVLACAIALVLIVRQPLRRQFGARLAYQAWLIIPAALGAMALPVTHAVQRPLSLPLTTLHVAGGQGAAIEAESHAWMHILLVLWLAGLMAAAIHFLLQHRRFLRELGELGKLQPLDRVFIAASVQAGPALVGLFRPKIIVPADFEKRYTAQEQALIVAHESTHQKRGDALTNALFSLLQCVFWFNPLIHIAAGRFRFDQELACDAAVMAQHPESRRSYADAMLKTQMASAITPVGCHWQSNHPLKERVMNLNQSAPRALRRAAGLALIASMLGASAYSAWAAQAPQVSPLQKGVPDAKIYEIKLTINDALGLTQPIVRARQGEPFAVAHGEGEEKLSYDFVVTPYKDKAVNLNMIAKHGEKVFSQPKLLVGLGQTGTLEMKGQEKGGDFTIKLKVTEVTQISPAP